MSSEYTGPKTMDEACSLDFLKKAFGSDAVELVDRKDLVGGVLSLTSMLTVKVGDKRQRVVVKIPTSVEGSRAFAVAGNAYMKEVNVYKKLKEDLASIDFTIPNIVYSDSDSTDNEQTCEWFVLVIEAFSPDKWSVQDQVKGMDYGPWKLAVADLAKFHAKFWKSDRIDEEWVTSKAAVEQNAGHSILAFFQPFHQGFPAAKTAFWDLWGNGTPNERTKLCCYFHDGPYVTGPANEEAGGTTFDLGPMKEALEFLALKEVCMPLHTKMYETIRSRPRTLTYGDYRGDNMFCNVEGTKMAYIDFQLFNAGPPGYDFNQPVGSFDFSVFSNYEEFVQIWYDTMAKQPNGKDIIAEYPKEHFMEDWIIGCIQFVTGIIPLGVGTFSQKTGDRMTNLWMYAINRYMMGMQKLNTHEYIKKLASECGFDYPSGKKI